MFCFHSILFTYVRFGLKSLYSVYSVLLLSFSFSLHHFSSLRQLCLLSLLFHPFNSNWLYIFSIPFPSYYYFSSLHFFPLDSLRFSSHHLLCFLFNSLYVSLHSLLLRIHHFTFPSLQFSLPPFTSLFFDFSFCLLLFTFFNSFHCLSLYIGLFRFHFIYFFIIPFVSYNFVSSHSYSILYVYFIYPHFCSLRFLSFFFSSH